ncbi:DUF4170 domain-containing protein [Maricaulis sp.]|uniref:DUF4170 domain-containing protein n=1 Tax=unclassified Maricaulis TaxID=2632371 RepID=UPI001B29FB04|nr:DUF4170 domain-containing protein [Maricaulis sp.]MBO6796385.1 DUF4170 domain-containing protein [Maricaulis sp.]
MKKDNELNQQLLHLVIGGELACVTPDNCEFKDLEEVDFVGAFGTYEEARAAWKGAAQRTVDNAHMRYFIIHAHKLLEPQTGK